jgi:hypothetical protein
MHFAIRKQMSGICMWLTTADPYPRWGGFSEAKKYRSRLAANKVVWRLPQQDRWHAQAVEVVERQEAPTAARPKLAS